MEQRKIYCSSYITAPDSRNNAISVLCQKGLFFWFKRAQKVWFFLVKMGLFWVCFFEIWVCFINWLHCLTLRTWWQITLRKHQQTD